MASDPLTPRQAAFVREYLIDLNATQAAIRAGYSKKTAKAAASRMLTFVNVSQAIAAGKKRKSEKANVTAERVINELAELAFIPLAEINKPDSFMRPSDKIKALELLAKHTGALKDEGSSETNIQINIIQPTAPAAVMQLIPEEK